MSASQSSGRRGPEMKVRQADELFERDEAPRSANQAAEVEPRPFREHLRSTPAAPMAPSIQALLWAAAVAVALLFGAALWKMGQKKPAKTMDQGRSMIESASAPARI